MITFIKGILECVTDNSIIIDCNGVGYEVFVSTATMSNICKMGEQLKINTYMQVREDGVCLFGFLTKEELKMFNLLISVSGIGPKVALSVLACFKPSEIMLAIITEDTAKLGKAPGIGKKTAGRMILELKDKIKTSDSISDVIDNQQQINTGDNSPKQDAIDALIALGYSRSEALKGVLEVSVEGMSTEQIIKQTLRKLSTYNL